MRSRTIFSSSVASRCFMRLGSPAYYVPIRRTYSAAEGLAASEQATNQTTNANSQQPPRDGDEEAAAAELLQRKEETNRALKFANAQSRHVDAIFQQTFGYPLSDGSGGGSAAESDNGEGLEGGSMFRTHVKVVSRYYQPQSASGRPQRQRRRSPSANSVVCSVDLYCGPCVTVELSRIVDDEVSSSSPTSTSSSSSSAAETTRRIASATFRAKSRALSIVPNERVRNMLERCLQDCEEYHVLERLHRAMQGEMTVRVRSATTVSNEEMNLYVSMSPKRQDAEEGERSRNGGKGRGGGGGRQHASSSLPPQRSPLYFVLIESTLPVDYLPQLPMFMSPVMEDDAVDVATTTTMAAVRNVGGGSSVHAAVVCVEGHPQSLYPAIRQAFKRATDIFSDPRHLRDMDRLQKDTLNRESELLLRHWQPFVDMSGHYLAQALSSSSVLSPLWCCSSSSEEVAGPSSSSSTVLRTHRQPFARRPEQRMDQRLQLEEDEGQILSSPTTSTSYSSSEESLVVKNANDNKKKKMISLLAIEDASLRYFSYARLLDWLGRVNRISTLQLAVAAVVGGENTAVSRLPFASSSSCMYSLDEVFFRLEGLCRASWQLRAAILFLSLVDLGQWTPDVLTHIVSEVARETPAVCLRVECPSVDFQATLKPSTIIAVGATPQFKRTTTKRAAVVGGATLASKRISASKVEQEFAASQEKKKAINTLKLHNAEEICALITFIPAVSTTNGRSVSSDVSGSELMTPFQAVRMAMQSVALTLRGAVSRALADLRNCPTMSSSTGSAPLPPFFGFIERRAKALLRLLEDLCEGATLEPPLHALPQSTATPRDIVDLFLGRSCQVIEAKNTSSVTALHFRMPNVPCISSITRCLELLGPVLSDTAAAALTRSNQQQGEALARWFQRKSFLSSSTDRRGPGANSARNEQNPHHHQSVDRSIEVPNIILLLQQMREMLRLDWQTMPSMHVEQTAQYDVERHLLHVAHQRTVWISTITHLTLSWPGTPFHVTVQNGTTTRSNDDADDAETTSAATMVGPLRLLMRAVVELYLAVVVAGTATNRYGSRPRRVGDIMTPSPPTPLHKDNDPRVAQLRGSIPKLIVRDATKRSKLVDFLMYAWFNSPPHERLFLIKQHPVQTSISAPPRTAASSSSSSSSVGSVDDRRTTVDPAKAWCEGDKSTTSDYSDDDGASTTTHQQLNPQDTAQEATRISQGLHLSMVRCLLFYDFLGCRVLFAGVHSFNDCVAQRELDVYALACNTPMDQRLARVTTISQRYNLAATGGKKLTSPFQMYFALFDRMDYDAKILLLQNDERTTTEMEGGNKRKGGRRLLLSLKRRNAGPPRSSGGDDDDDEDAHSRLDIPIKASSLSPPGGVSSELAGLEAACSTAVRRLLSSSPSKADALIAAASNLRCVLARDGFPLHYDAALYTPTNLLGEILQGTCGRYECCYMTIPDKGRSGERVFQCTTYVTSVCGVAVTRVASVPPPHRHHHEEVAEDIQEGYGEHQALAKKEHQRFILDEGEVADDDAIGEGIVIGVGTGIDKTSAWKESSRMSLLHAFPDVMQQVEALKAYSDAVSDDVSVAIAVGLAPGVTVSFARRPPSVVLRSDGEKHAVLEATCTIQAQDGGAEWTGSGSSDSAAFMDAVGKLTHQVVYVKRAKQTVTLPPAATINHQLRFQTWDPTSNFHKSALHARLGALGNELRGKVRVSVSRNGREAFITLEMMDAEQRLRYLALYATPPPASNNNIGSRRTSGLEDMIAALDAQVAAHAQPHTRDDLQVLLQFLRSDASQHDTSFRVSPRRRVERLGHRAFGYQCEAFAVNGRRGWSANLVVYLPLAHDDIIAGHRHAADKTKLFSIVKRRSEREAWTVGGRESGADGPAMADKVRVVVATCSEGHRTSLEAYTALLDVLIDTLGRWRLFGV